MRLTRAATGWRVTAVHPSRPGSPRGRLSTDERAVLRSPRIVSSSGSPRGRRVGSGARDHPRRRAFDTFSIDGRLVVSASTSRRLVTGFMEAAAAAGAYNLGAPYLLGAAPQYFSDNTHHDHVHAGFAT